MTTMKKVLVVTVAAMAAFTVQAQQRTERPEGRQEGRAKGRQERQVEHPMGGRMMMGGGGFDQNMLLLRLMDDPETAQAIKLTEAQKEALKTGSQALDERQTMVNEALRIAALEQATLAAKVMADKQASSDDLMAQVEKVGALRIEQAKIQTEKLLVIRDTLTAEQIRAAGDLATQRMAKMRERMRERTRQRPERGADNPRNAPLPQRPKGWDE